MGFIWPKFKNALKEEYFLEDSQRVTKQIFMKWINQMNNGHFARKLLWDYEKKYEQLSFIGNDWKLVPKAVNMIVKHQMQVDKLIVADSFDKSDEETQDKPTSSKQKLEEPIMDDLVKGIQ
ncbi:hypothetical protein L7F22_008084 [Adiantum nelumboides]|nr:hypothetical protein [Adiantum nelumboides]